MQVIHEKKDCQPCKSIVSIANGCAYRGIATGLIHQFWGVTDYEKQQPLSRIREYLAEKGIATSVSNLHFFIKRRSVKDLSPLNCSGETVDIDTGLNPDMNTEAESGARYVVREDWRKHVTREEYADIIYIAMFKVLSGNEGNALTSYVTSVHGLNHPNPTDENWDEGLRFIEDLRLNKYGIESLWIKTMLLANRKDLLTRI